MTDMERERKWGQDDAEFSVESSGDGDAIKA